jgi:DnaJ-class molecular chaperone
MDMDELNSMFDTFFGGGRGADFGSAGKTRGGRRASQAVPDPEPQVTEHDLDISFLTAVRGGAEHVRFSIGNKTKSIEVTIPKGITSGTKLRVRAGGDFGDIVFRIRIGKHPFFRRTEWPHPDVPDGLDLYLDLPLNIAEAALGATVTVPTLDAPVDLTVPPGTASGRKLRLRGRGIEDARGSRGDLYAVVRIVPPDGTALSEDEAEALRKTVERFPNPRAGQGWPVTQ